MGNPEEAALSEDIRVLIEDAFDQVEVLNWDSILTPAQPPPPCTTWPYAGEHVAAALSMRPDLVDHLDELTDYAKHIYTAGLTQPAHQYLAATNRERQHGLELGHALERFDYAFSVVAPEAPQLVDDCAPIPFPRLALLNIAGLPAASIPFGTYSSGLPRALQVIGRYGDDTGVLALADRITRLM